MFAVRNSATERAGNDVLLWLDPDNEWVIWEAEQILRAVADPLVHQARSDVTVAPGRRPPCAVTDPEQSHRLQRIEHEDLGRATQRAPPHTPRDIGAHRAEPGDRKKGGEHYRQFPLTMSAGRGRLVADEDWPSQVEASRPRPPPREPGRQQSQLRPHHTLNDDPGCGGVRTISLRVVFRSFADGDLIHLTATDHRSVGHLARLAAKIGLPKFVLSDRGYDCQAASFASTAEPSVHHHLSRVECQLRRRRDSLARNFSFSAGLTLQG
jgi:hypothetical protein